MLLPILFLDFVKLQRIVYAEFSMHVFEWPKTEEIEFIIVNKLIEQLRIWLQDAILLLNKMVDLLDIWYIFNKLHS